VKLALVNRQAPEAQFRNKIFYTGVHPQTLPHRHATTYVFSWNTCCTSVNKFKRCFLPIWCFQAILPIPSIFKYCRHPWTTNNKEFMQNQRFHPH